MDSVQILLSGLRYTYSPQRPILNKVYRVEALNPATGEYEAVERSDAKRYKVAFSWTTAQSLGLVSANSKGLLDVKLYDESGALLDTDEKLRKRIVYCQGPEGQPQELKEWYALYRTLSGFPPNADGVAEVPARYGEPAAYMLQTTADLGTFFRNPSRIFWLMLAAGAVVLLLIALITALLVRRHRRRRARKG